MWWKMTYRELFYKATRLINNDKITLGEYDEMTKPLDREVEQESILDKLRAEIETKYGQCSICEYDSDYGGKWYQVGDIADILQIIDKYKNER